MRSYGATALVAFLILAECLGARDRSRSRSGSNRSAPAASAKREADFDCPEEFGYYPHPTDCTLYYVCVFGGALLESCTGGLMYSHELQTCDWPRNVGCDATVAVVGESERINERNPLPPPLPPRRTPPPPPPRAQPNPVITSRGQPKYNRQEYEKQEQLYAEVDDLPPVEELESDRQQRVYRGQPSTIGQVQKDRDGYGTQPISSGRTLNSNIIPASIPQNSGKFGSYSFGTQVDERRTATVTQAPQTYRADSNYKTDNFLDKDINIESNSIVENDKEIVRRKRDLDEGRNNSTILDKIFEKSDSDEVFEYIGDDTEPKISYNDSNDGFETDRDKRQIRYIFEKHAFKPENTPNSKFVDMTRFTQFNQNLQNPRYQNGYYNGNVNMQRKPYLSENSFLTTVPLSSHLSYPSESMLRQRPFKPSLPDPTNQKLYHNPGSSQIITKSPPISSLNIKENPFLASLSGGFYNNAPKQTIQQGSERPKMLYPHDSSQVSSTVVTNKPLQLASLMPQYDSQAKVENSQHNLKEKLKYINSNHKKNQYEKPVENDDYYDDYESNESDGPSEEDYDKNFKPDFPNPPYSFKHPSNKYTDIENPFADPKFDFDKFLANLQNDHYSSYHQTSSKPKNVYSSSFSSNKMPVEITTLPYQKTVLLSTTLSGQSMSTPRPFTFSNILSSTSSPIQNNFHVLSTSKYNPFSPTAPTRHDQQQKETNNNNNYSKYKKQSQQLVEAVLPNLKPPNFTDERQLPITLSFNKPIEPTRVAPYNITSNNLSLAQKPYVIITSTGSPFILSSPSKKQQNLNVQFHTSLKPFTIPSFQQKKIYNADLRVTTPKTLTTVANEQLSALQQYWKTNSFNKPSIHSSNKPSMISVTPQYETILSKAVKISTQSPYQPYLVYSSTPTPFVGTTKKVIIERKPIPKPSPEMNDYYYDDDDEHYYYEPVVKPKYMPSSEIKPQRPPMAQNYREYDDSYDNNEDHSLNLKQTGSITNHPIGNNKYIQETLTKDNNNEKNVKEKDLPAVKQTHASNFLRRPEVSNYEVNHHIPQNRSIHLKKPVLTVNGPNTIKPPKYLNQTTLRPYTIRHRLAKPPPTEETKEFKQKRNKGRHRNIVAQMLNTPRDNYNQETRYTKAKHDGKTNSLEPTESITPSSYSPSPRPKMLYNGTQSYSPDQFDPFYAVYDEDGELYKDTDYVQQYNTASLRPTIQQTYRGTSPPTRRPVETYTPRPVPSDDYDDVLIQGQISNQNQYQPPNRHSTRGEGNELGYEHNLNSARTTVYEATSKSTTPSTTSTTTTTTTTQRSTTALYTEAMTPSRFTSRLSADENPDISSTQNSLNESSLVPSSHSPVINISSRAKPFRRTENSHRLDTLTSTERLTTTKFSTLATNDDDNQKVKNVKKNVFTTGFSIRQNINNTKNPYTLTVITRPFDGNSTSQKVITFESKTKNNDIGKGYHYNSNKENVKAAVTTRVSIETSTETTSRRPVNRRRKRPNVINEQNGNHYYVKVKNGRQRKRINTTPTVISNSKKKLPNLRHLKPISDTYTTEHTEITESPKHIIKKETEAPITETDLANKNKYVNQLEEAAQEATSEASLVPFKLFRGIKNSYIEDSAHDYSTSSTTTTAYTTTVRTLNHEKYDAADYTYEKPFYYSYSVDDENIPNHTTEVFSGKARNVIKAFFNELSSTPKIIKELYFTTPKISSSTSENVVNIGYQKKVLKHFDSKPFRTNIKSLEIITEPSVSRYIPSNLNLISFTQPIDDISQGLGTDAISTESFTTTPLIYTNLEPTYKTTESLNDNSFSESDDNSFKSKFTKILTTSNPIENSFNDDGIFIDNQSAEGNVYSNTSYTEPINERNDPNMSKIDDASLTTDTDNQPLPIMSDVASTTSTTKLTTTAKVELKMTTQSLSFPTRVSRVNPAIKLAAANLGGGRRSYQSSTNCSSDNSLQANPKCNEIKYQRPSSTRGRGSAHYSTSNGSEAPQQQTNRGTPPTRSRPTLKPSTAIVSEARFVDIYAHAPQRPAPVYPQPTPDKTAAKCRKDVCLLPDCYCGGKDIPGDLPLESVPQIVLLTFDDSVNDLNKVLYSDLFEKGRVNPNGCPISATFYVSHEWTDYSQVQNLYASGHEMASHTISHSFGEQFSQKKWNREVGGQREILAAYGGVKLEDVRGMRAPFLSVGGNKMFKMLYDSNFTYDSSLPVYENRPPSWPYTLDYKLFHDCMIPPCPTKSYPGVWEVPMVMWQDLNGGRCSMGDACANPPESEGVYKMLLKNFDRHYTSNRAPFGLFYHAAWFTQPHHKEGFIMFLDYINQMKDVWIVTNWQALQWVRDPTPISRLNNFQPFQCNYPDRPKKCNNPKVCNLWHKSGVRYMRTCQPCPEIYPWTGKTGIKSSRIDNDIGE